jgi:glycine/D-amino acid oxidase-like deaminating enzyme
MPSRDAVNWRRSSLWAGPLVPRFECVTVDRSVDVVVVGAGITGLLTATLLNRSGAQVLVVDRYEVGGVATRNTTAKISALQGTAYSEIAARRGSEVAAQYAAAQLDAVEGLRALIAELEIECALNQAPAFTHATERQAAERARAEYAAALAAGLPVQWTETSELPFPVIGAVQLDGQLHFHPGLFCTALASTLGPEHVAESVVVQAVDESRDGCTVTLENGATIKAGNVVIATQGPIVDPGLLANRCTPMQSYALAARISGEIPSGMYLSCDRAVRSLRPASTADGPVMVVGGEGHPMGDAGAQPERWDTLAEWTDEHFGAARVTHRWATHDLVPTDRVPFIGRLGPTADRRWVATGFSKWGMTNGYVAARIISEAIGGSHVEWASTFDSTRLASTLSRGLISIGATAAQHLVVDRVKRRDEPRCTHQHCVLRHDEALGTWDCPCHGSRFDENGTVIQGPASAPLAPRSSD